MTVKTLIMKTKTSQLKTAWKNPVKELLKKGKPAVGIVISVNSVEVATQAAALGFDFLWLEMEHTPVSLETVRNVVLATRGLSAVPIARPPAKRAMDGQTVFGLRRPRGHIPFHQHSRAGSASCSRLPVSAAGIARLRGRPGSFPLADSRGLLRFRRPECAGGGGG